MRILILFFLLVAVGSLTAASAYASNIDSLMPGTVSADPSLVLSPPGPLNGLVTSHTSLSGLDPTTLSVVEGFEKYAAQANASLYMRQWANTSHNFTDAIFETPSPNVAQQMLQGAAGATSGSSFNIPGVPGAVTSAGIIHGTETWRVAELSGNYLVMIATADPVVGASGTADFAQLQYLKLSGVSSGSGNSTSSSSSGGAFSLGQLAFILFFLACVVVVIVQVVRKRKRVSD